LLEKNRGEILKIIHITAEIAPIAKVGGLGDVVGGLSLALTKENIKVEVILPKYKNINSKYLKNLKIINKNFKIFEKGRWQKNTIYSANFKGIKIFLIEDQKNYFNRKKIYSYKDDIARFLYFNKAALEFLKQRKSKIDILHLHDWHVCLIAPLYKKIYSKQNLKAKAIVLSIHNFKYQGLCKPKDLKKLGFNGNYFLKKEMLQDPKRPRTLNLLKGGLIYSDKIFPVSENYAKEILTKKHSCHLYPIVKNNRKKIKGITNGIDEHYWNPKTDIYIKYKYSANSFEKILKAKKQNKIFLQNLLNLKQKNVPLICSIGRLVEQKGPKLIKHAIMHSLEKNAQFILLGSPFDKKTKKSFNSLKKSLKTNKNVSINFGFNEKLSHQIYAAADFIIIPSLFEPCGLTQMISLRYGGMPIVRKTGGLADTVFDIDDKSIPEKKKNGFTFKEFSIRGVNFALDRAINFWHKNNEKFNFLISKNMKNDFSWKTAAKKYIKEYKKLLK
jgi:starch synthase